MSQRRVAGSQNPVRAKVDAQFLFERLLHINLGEHAQAFSLACFGHARKRRRSTQPFHALPRRRLHAFANQASPPGFGPAEPFDASQHLKRQEEA